MFKNPDPLDNAAELADRFTQESIENVLRKGGQEPLPFKGTCYNCLANLQKPHRFCDEECAEEWEYVQERRKANRLS